METSSFEKLNRELQNEKFFVVDTKVFDLHKESLACLKDSHLFLVDDPEASKSFDSLETIVNFLLKNKISRKDKVVAIGGGALSDLAGFAASIVLRGVDWIAVPTTLLAMVDASIGGKTAINSEHGKNLAGAFHLPSKILAAPEFLQTLSRQELLSGRGEILKYAFLDKNVSLLLEEKAPEAEVIAKCAEVKNEIVEKDFKESGERTKLNLGHTFGHVFEKMTGMPHGICVAMGLEVVIDLFSPSLLNDFYALKDSLEIEYQLPVGLEREKFWDFLASDKKKTGDEILLVVPKSLGHSNLEKISLNELKEVFNSHDKYTAIFK